jgi:hypothetical protein
MKRLFKFPLIAGVEGNPFGVHKDKPGKVGGAFRDGFLLLLLVMTCWK